MKKIPLILLCLFVALFAEDIDTEIKDLKNEIKSYGAVPQSEILEKKSQEKKDKNGLFVGIMGGYGVIKNTYEDGKYITENNVDGGEITGVILPNWTTSNPMFLFGGKIGYQNFFNSYFGTRIYGDVIVGFGEVQKDGVTIGSSQYALGALNLDVMGEYPIGKHFEIGAFLGFGFGVMLFSDAPKDLHSFTLDSATTSKHIFWQNLLQVDYTVNVGASFVIQKQHRIEIGVKIPVTYLKLGLETPANYMTTSESKTLDSGDLTFKRTPYVLMSYIYLF